MGEEVTGGGALRRIGEATVLLTLGLSVVPSVETRSAQGEEQDERSLEWWVGRLESPDDDARENAVEALALEGERAVAAVLGGFDEASPRARRLRAGVVRRSGSAAAVARVVEFLADPDPGVREEWGGFLGRRDLPRETLAERLKGLARLAEDDDPGVRASSLQALRLLDEPEGAKIVADLAASPDAEERDRALFVLATMPAGRPYLLDLAFRFDETEPALLAILFPPLGAALAYLEVRGSLPEPSKALALFAKHWADPDPEVRGDPRLSLRGARPGFLAWIRGLADRGQAERAAVRLEALAAQVGWPIDLLDEVVHHHLYKTRDDVAARDAARRLSASAEKSEGREGRRASARALLYEAILDLAAGEASRADAALRSASQVLERLRRDEAAEAGQGFDHGEDTILLAEAHGLRALNALVNGSTPDLPDPRGEITKAYELSLDAGDTYGAAENLRYLSLDGVLRDPLGPETVAWEVLVPRKRAREAGQALRKFGEILSTLNPKEFPPVWEGARSVPAGVARIDRPVVSEFPRRLASFEADILGNSDEGLRILDRLLGNLEARGDTHELVAVALAHRGGILSRLRRGEEARASYLRAARTLEAIREMAEKGGFPLSVARLNAGLVGIYQGLAVNDNVVRGDRAGSLAWRQKALELVPSDFNRVLYACHLAREGQAEEARATLVSVAPAPDLYYNLACTHALLGEIEPAFEFLRLHFEERAAGGGSLGTERDWTWKDPDLRRLRSDPRFRQIVGEAPPSRPQ